MTRIRRRSNREADRGSSRLYTLQVFLLSGPVTEKFAEKHPVISRTIQIRGDQTLEDLHHAIFDAHGRIDDHLYEFQFGKGPFDPKGKRYVVNADVYEAGSGPKVAGDVRETSIDCLGLEVNQAFGYWFDFGDDWFHQIDVVAIADETLRRKFPRVIERTGESPPQYGS